MANMEVVPCKACGVPMVTPVIKEPCECGLTEGARIARWVALAATTLFISFFGGCWVTHKYEYEKVRELRNEQYEIQQVHPGAGPFPFNNPSERVILKKPQEK